MDPQKAANVILLLAAFYGVEWVMDIIRHNDLAHAPGANEKPFK